MTVATVLAAAAGLILAAPSIATAQNRQDGDRITRLESDFAPPIDLWLDQDTYDRGAHMRPYFSTEPGAYVVVVRVTTGGELRVMYPVRPGAQKPYSIGQYAHDRIPNSDDPSLNLYESTGNGLVFAIASYKAFDFSYFRQGNSWSTARLASFGRYGDPFQVVRAFVDKILPQNADYSLDYEVYEVYARGTRSAYGSSIYGGRYGYASLSDYHDACLTAFGVRHSYYCQSYRGGYYGPIIVANPRPNAPAGHPVARPGGKKMKNPRPVTPDPIVTSVPPRPEPAEGRQAGTDAADRAAREYYERKRREADSRSARSEPAMSAPQSRPQPLTNEPVIYRSYPRPERPQSQPQGQPQSQGQYQPRSEPRSESRPQASQPVRAEPRPVTPARVEVRNEPRTERPREAPRPAPAPAKDNGKT